MNGKATDSRILDRVPDHMPTSLDTTRLDAHQAPHCWWPHGCSTHCHPQSACSTRDFAGEWPIGAHGCTPDGTLLAHLASANARSFERSRVASGVAVVTRLVGTDSITSLPPVLRPVLN